MCTRTRIRSMRGLEFETTQFSGESSSPTFFSPVQAAEFCTRLADDSPNELPESQLITHPTTGETVLEIWVDYYESALFHPNSEGLYDVSELSWDD